MNNKPPAFQWYPKDILSSKRVALMTLREEGAYRRAIDFCWLHGSLPADIGKLAMIIGKGCTAKVAGAVKAMFIEENGELRHDRLDTEREKQKEHSERQRDRAGKRWDKSGIARNDAVALLRHKNPQCQNDALHLQSSSPSPSPISTKVQTPAGGDEKKEIEKIKVELPWCTPVFSEAWQNWKNFRAREKRIRFKTPESELAQLKRLHGLALGNEQTAIEIIEQSIGNQWTGLFQLSSKNNIQHATGSNNTKTPIWRR